MQGACSRGRRRSANWPSTCQCSVGKDGIWPCEPVRDLLDSLASRHVGIGFVVGKSNLRGVRRGLCSRVLDRNGRLQTGVLTTRLGLQRHGRSPPSYYANLRRATSLRLAAKTSKPIGQTSSRHRTPVKGPHSSRASGPRQKHQPAVRLYDTSVPSSRTWAC